MPRKKFKELKKKLIFKKTRTKYTLRRLKSEKHGKRGLGDLKRHTSKK